MTDLRDRPELGPPGGAGEPQRPRTVAEAAALLRDTSGPVLLRGGGTKLDWAGRVDPPDLILDTRDLRGVLTHTPADMTASVRAGTTLTELQQHLAGDGQWLALDPPTSTVGATVGGLLATGDSGPSRLRYGGIRDLVIGVTLVLADGTVARSGGHVIKNVAGYDLAKIVHGSLGSLALVAEVVVRLHPLPAASVTSSAMATAEQATTAALALSAGPLEPAAVEWVSDPGSLGRAGRLYVRIDGTEAYAKGATTRLHDELATLGVESVSLPPAAAAEAWRSHGRAVLGDEGETSVRVCGLPADLGRFAARSTQLAAELDIDLQLVSSAALGMHTVRLTGSASAQAEMLAALQLEAAARGGSVLLRSRSAELDGLVDALGPAPSSAALLKMIKHEFDPAGRLAPGRFRPWY